jgi:hypothetical protein
MSTSTRVQAKKNFLLNPQFLSGYGLILLFALFVFSVFLVHAGRVLNYGFPALSTMLAIILFITRRGVYISFVWWIWLFTPLVRRLVDYQSVYHSVSPVMVTPLLVTMLASLLVASRPRIVLQRKFLPFSIFSLALTYGFCLGVIQNGILPAFFDFVSWGIPLGFGLFLLADLKNADENQASFLFAAISGLLVTSVYGIYQFYNFPDWDKFWLAQSHFGAAGLGVALQVRLFGTLNSPGPYGIALMAPLVLALIAKGPLKLVASIAGFTAFGLSLVRSAWGGWLLAVMYLVARMGGKARLRILATALVISGFTFPLVSAGPAASVLSKRFSSLSNIQQDGSYKNRLDLYKNFTVTALSQPLGMGLGINGLAAKLNPNATSGFDSGLLEVPYVFGWPGGIMFIWAISVIVYRILFSQKSSKDSFAIACGGIFFAVLAENIAGLTFTGVAGFILWGAAAMAYKMPASDKSGSL